MRIGLIGAGNMASALARGLGVPVVVSDVVEEKAVALARDTGGEAVGSNAEVAERADMLVLCHKPGQLQEVAEQVGGRAKVVVTILAATTTEGETTRASRCTLHPEHPCRGGPRRAAMPQARAPRRARSGRFSSCSGVRAYHPLDDEPARAGDGADEAAGRRSWPIVAESFVDAGVHHGLSRDDASRMVVETMVGTAEYLKAHDLDTEALRVKVATPGGVTERGLMSSRKAPCARWPARGRHGGRGDEVKVLLAVTRGDVADRQHARTGLSGPDLHQDHHDGSRGSRTTFLDMVLGFVRDVTDPYLNLFRRFIPPVRMGPGALDLSPISHVPADHRRQHRRLAIRG